MMVTKPDASWDGADRRVADIDPVRYGVLWQKVQDMDKKMDKMEGKIEQLLSMADRSKGVIWIGMGIWSAATAVAGFFIGKH
jgi:hypothetical protein